MPKATIFIYVIDLLDAPKADKLRKALLVNPRIFDVSIKLNAGVIEVTSEKDPEAEVKMACSIAGCSFRMRTSKRKATYWA